MVSHMPKKKVIDWNEKVFSFGYENLYDMLYDMFILRNEAPHIMALRLDCGIGTVYSKLREFGLRRGRKNISKTWGSRGF